MTILGIFLCKVPGGGGGGQEGQKTGLVGQERRWQGARWGQGGGGQEGQMAAEGGMAGLEGQMGVARGGGHRRRVAGVPDRESRGQIGDSVGVLGGWIVDTGWGFR